MTALWWFAALVWLAVGLLIARDRRREQERLEEWREQMARVPDFPPADWFHEHEEA